MDASGQGYGICSDKLRLNGPYQEQAGYAFHTTPQLVLSGLTTKFQFQIVDRAEKCRYIRNSLQDTRFYEHCQEKGADGFAFVLKGPNVTTLGSNGRELGYGGIENSFAIEFDTWWNEQIEPNQGMSGHISVHSRGNTSNSANHSFSLGSIAVPSMLSSLVKTVVIKYTPGNFTLESVNEDVIDNDRTSVMSPGHLMTSQYHRQWFGVRSPSVGLLEVFFENLETPLLSLPVDLSNFMHLPDGYATVGFTSGTAGLYQAHDILQWFFCEGVTCEGNSWMQNSTENSFSYCNTEPCPRGYPFNLYPAKVATTVLGATT